MDKKAVMEAYRRKLEILRERAHKSHLTRTSLDSSLIVEQVNTAAKFSEVWRAYVPRGHVFWLDGSRAFRLLFGFVETIVSDVGAGDMTFETTHFPARVLDSADGYSDGDYQRVYEKAAGTSCPVVSAVDNEDGGTPSITATVVGDADHQVCYTPYFDGDLVIRVESPRGESALGAVVYRHNLIGLHVENQPLTNACGWTGPLPPDYSVAIYLTSAYVIAWANGCTAGAATLPMAQVKFPIGTLPEHLFFVAGERAPGDVLRQEADRMIGAQ